MTAPLRAAVFGASGAIGAALLERLQRDPRYGDVTALSRRGEGHLHFDLADEASIAAAAAALAEGGPLDLVFVATGVLQEPGKPGPEKALRALDPSALAHQFAVNAIGPALIAKHLFPLLPRDRRAVFAALSARVGSIGDNALGGWHGYRAAKAALNMLLRNAALELKRSHPLAVVAALHPGTVDSALSRPFQRGLRPGQLTTPELAADRLLAVLDGLTPDDSGFLYDYTGTRLPF